MSDTLKALLVVASILTVAWILRKIRKSKVKWKMLFSGFLCGILLILAIFPEISYKLCQIFGIMSPSNLVFLVIIFLLGRAKYLLYLLLFPSWKIRLVY